MAIGTFGQHNQAKGNTWMSLANNHDRTSIAIKKIPLQWWIVAIPTFAYMKLAYLSQALTLLLAVTNKTKKHVPLSSQFWILFLLPLYVALILRHFFLLDSWVAYSEAKYYFGFIFFYPAILWCSLGTRVAMVTLSKGLLGVLVYSVIIEAGLINLFPKFLGYLGNYPDFTVHISHRTQYFGFYQRPYGLGGSYAETSSLIGILLTYLLIQRQKASTYLTLASIAAVLLCMSGTGYAFMLLYFVVAALLSAYRLVIWPLVIIAAAVPFAVTFVPGFSDASPLWKISAPYIGYLIKSKFLLLIPIQQTKFEWFSIFFGRIELMRRQPLTWTDFGASTLIDAFGIAGLMLTFLTTAVHLNRKNAIPLAFLLLSMSHYSALFSQVGQLVFCIFLLTGKPEIKPNTPII